MEIWKIERATTDFYLFQFCRIFCPENNSILMSNVLLSQHWCFSLQNILDIMIWVMCSCHAFYILHFVSSRCAILESDPFFMKCQTSCFPGSVTTFTLLFSVQFEMFTHNMRDGWGLATNGEVLFGSDGSSTLYQIDPQSKKGLFKFMLILSFLTI